MSPPRRQVEEAFKTLKGDLKGAPQLSGQPAGAPLRNVSMP